MRLFWVGVMVNGRPESNDPEALGRYAIHFGRIDVLHASEADILSRVVFFAADASRHSYLHFVLSLVAVSGVKKGAAFEHSLLIVIVVAFVQVFVSI